MEEQTNNVAEATLKALSDLQSEIEDTVLDSEQAIDEYRIRFLSRKQGQITSLLKRIPDVAPQDRKGFGQQINAAKSRVEARIDESTESLRGEA